MFYEGCEKIYMLNEKHFFFVQTVGHADEAWKVYPCLCTGWVWTVFLQLFCPRNLKCLEI